MTDDPRKPEVRGLLERHLAFCLSETPPKHSFALNVDGLLDPKVTFVSFRDGGAASRRGGDQGSSTRRMPN